MPVPTLEMEVWGRTSARWLPGFQLSSPGCLRALPKLVTQLSIQTAWEIQEIWVEVLFGSAFKICCKQIRKIYLETFIGLGIGLTITGTPIKGYCFVNVQSKWHRSILHISDYSCAWALVEWNLMLLYRFSLSNSYNGCI